MKRKFKTFIAALVLTIAAGTGQAMATPVSGSSLQNILNGITTGPNPGVSSVNVQTDQITEGTDAYWQISGSGGALATMILEVSGFAGDNTFGIYDSNHPDKKVQLFSGAATTGSMSLVSILADGSVFYNFMDTGVDFERNSFGFYITTPEDRGRTYYSNTLLNPDGFDHMVAYEGTGTDTIQLGPYSPGPWSSNEFILAFEDLYGGGDRDYDDLVVMMESIEVPEPGTLMLIGSGLAGLTLYVRKRRISRG